MNAFSASIFTEQTQASLKEDAYNLTISGNNTASSILEFDDAILLMETEEMRSKYISLLESQKENLDIRFSSLPELLQHRIALFRKFDDNFRKNEENYESLVVLAAYQIYRLCHNPFDIMNFYFADVARKEQIAPVVREYSFSDNQLACACTLARFLNKDDCSMDINAPYHVQLLHSGVMNFSNAALPFSGPRCTPRQEYITKYLVEL